MTEILKKKTHSDDTEALLKPRCGAFSDMACTCTFLQCVRFF